MSSSLHGLLSLLLLQLIAVKTCHEMGFTADPGHGVLLTADTAHCEHLLKQILIYFYVLIIPCLLFLYVDRVFAELIFSYLLRNSNKTSISIWYLVSR